MMGLPFRVYAYDTVTGVSRSATPYPNVDAIVGLWGTTMPTLVRVDGRWELVDVEVRDLEDYEAFPAWDHAAARSAAGVDRPLDLRLA